MELARIAYNKRPALAVHLHRQSYKFFSQYFGMAGEKHPKLAVNRFDYILKQNNKETMNVQN